MACRTCDYCGSVTTDLRRRRCPECRLLVCDPCWHEEGKCCVACFTLMDRMLAVQRALD